MKENIILQLIKWIETRQIPIKPYSFTLTRFDEITEYNINITTVI